MIIDLNKYEINHCCYATVEDNRHGGVHLILDNGEEAFAYNFSSLAPKTVVYCTVRKEAEPNRKKLVSIDSVRELI